MSDTQPCQRCHDSHSLKWPIYTISKFAYLCGNCYVYCNSRSLSWWLAYKELHPELEDPLKIEPPLADLPTFFELLLSQERGIDGLSNPHNPQE